MMNLELDKENKKMRTINKLFIAGELNRWLYWKIEGLFIEDYSRIDKLQKNFFKWVGLYAFVYLLVTSWVDPKTSIFEWWVTIFLLLPTVLYFTLKHFRFVRFMHYYNSLRYALSIDYFGFDHFLSELDRDLNHVVSDPDGYMYQNLIRQLRNGILSIEAKFGDRAQETSEWLYYRDRFSQSFLFLKRFRLIAKPDQGWTPYLRLAKEPIIRESNPS